MQESTKDNLQSPSRKSLFSPIYISRNRYLFVIGLFTLAGVIGGYAYYTFIGCHSGSCSIASNPTLSIIWGGMMGYLLPDFFIKQKK